jgi:SET domain-containing protein
MSKIIVKNISANHRGVFATEKIKKGEVIEVCPVIAIPKKQSKLIRKTILDNYVFDWSTHNQPAVVLGLGSLYNHSYSPNAEHDENVKKKVMIFKALRDIKKGEEITHNYNGDHDNKEDVWFRVVKR